MTLEFWRDISAIWLALFCIIGMSIPLVLAALAVKGLHQLVARTPGWLGTARRASATVRRVGESGSRRVIAPIISVHRTTARVTTVLQRLGGSRPGQHKGTRP